MEEPSNATDPDFGYASWDSWDETPSPDSYFVINNNSIVELSDEGMAAKQISLPSKHISNSSILSGSNCKRLIIPSDFFQYNSTQQVLTDSSVKYVKCNSIEYVNNADYTDTRGYSTPSSALTGFYIPDGVEYIPPYFFINECNLRFVRFPDGLKEIGRSAFACSGIKNIKYITGDSSFAIARFCFRQMPNLKNVHIKVSNMDYCSFGENPLLENIILEGDYDENHQWVFHIPYYGNSVGWVENCPNLTMVKLLMHNLNMFDLCCFKNCPNLTALILPFTVSYIKAVYQSGVINCETFIFNKNFNGFWHPEYSWYTAGEFFATFLKQKKFDVSKINNDKFETENAELDIKTGEALIENVTEETIFGKHLLSYVKSGQTVVCIGGEKDSFSNVRYIRNSAFYQSQTLRDLTINPSVKFIGHHAFMLCAMLETVTINADINNATEDTDGYVIANTIYSYSFTGCHNLRTVTLKELITVTGIGTFSQCWNLQTVNFSSNLTEIQDAAFQACLSLTSVTIPDSVTYIGNYAFNGCSSLTSITIPSSVTSIGESAFADCTGLTSITIPGSVTSIGESAFYGCSGLTISCYAGSATQRYAVANNIEYKLL